MCSGRQRRGEAEITRRQASGETRRLGIARHGVVEDGPASPPNAADSGQLHSSSTYEIIGLWCAISHTMTIRRSSNPKPGVVLSQHRMPRVVAAADDRDHQ